MGQRELHAQSHPFPLLGRWLDSMSQWKDVAM